MNGHQPLERPNDFLGRLTDSDFHGLAYGLGEIFEGNDDSRHYGTIFALADVEKKARVLTNNLNAPDALAKHILHWHRLDKNRFGHDGMPRGVIAPTASCARQLRERKLQTPCTAKPASLTLYRVSRIETRRAA